jgi:hypothetical protein
MGHWSYNYSKKRWTMNLLLIIRRHKQITTNNLSQKGQWANKATTDRRIATLLEKQAFVPVGNPHLYRVSNRYKASWTNVGRHLYQLGYPVQIQMWFAPVCSFPPSPLPFLLFSFLISFISSHLISSSSQNHRNNNTRFTSHLISSQHSHLITQINFHNNQFLHKYWTYIHHKPSEQCAIQQRVSVRW